jgi:uncharacterized membrane protein
MQKFTPLRIGIAMLGLNLVLIAFCAVFRFSLAAKIISMIVASHIGGRLAIIAVGLESVLPAYLVIIIIILYNTTFLLLMYSIFIFITSSVKKHKLLGSHFDSIKNKVKKRKRLFKKWNRFAIALFVWLPLPWTGAVIGSYLAHFEGFSTKDTLIIVVPSMWIGIITWTLWFDDLYKFIENFGKNKTLFITLFLLVIPFLVFVFNSIIKKNEN